ncbi:hypothetical protein LEP1GSC126_0186 [Leptospira kirschneri str. 200801774]|nr:hypothetical protein LEP1GSC126_0186 [Leptospira kirschneri str. 200801774]
MNTTDSIFINFYSLNCGSSHSILQANLNFAVVPTFKKTICKIRIPIFLESWVPYIEFTFF